MLLFFYCSKTALIALIINVLFVSLCEACSKVYKCKALCEWFATVIALKSPSRQLQVHLAAKARKISHKDQLLRVFACCPDIAFWTARRVCLKLYNDLDAVLLLAVARQAHSRNVKDVSQF